MSTFGFDRLLRNRRGNVAMMYALVAPVLVFGGGAAIDYGRAAQIHTKLNAAADAAALAALTPSMLQQSTQTAHDASVSMFNGLTEGIPGLTAHATQVTVTVTVGATSLIRNVAVSYSTSVNTIFAQVLGKSALPVSGVSQASAQAPPNIDFYVLLDNSPSMALPATAAGITQMQSLTTKQMTGGCAFACHQANTSYNTSTPTSSETDTVYNPCADGTNPTLRKFLDHHQQRQLLESLVRRLQGPRAARQLRARAQEQHHAPSGRIEQRRFDPAADRIDGRAVDRVRDPAKVSIFDLLHG